MGTSSCANDPSCLQIHTCYKTFQLIAEIGALGTRFGWGPQSGRVSGLAFPRLVMYLSKLIAQADEQLQDATEMN